MRVTSTAKAMQEVQEIKENAIMEIKKWPVKKQTPPLIKEYMRSRLQPFRTNVGYNLSPGRYLGEVIREVVTTFCDVESFCDSVAFVAEVVRTIRDDSKATVVLETLVQAEHLERICLFAMRHYGTAPTEENLSKFFGKGYRKC
jgi:hypothetical protein